MVKNNCCDIIREADGDTALNAPRVGRAYKVDFEPVDNVHAARESLHAPRDIWHARMGHPSDKPIDILAQQDLIKEYDLKQGMRVLDCHACLKSKTSRTSFTRSKSRVATKKLELVHSDLCGPMSINSLGG